MDSDEVECVGVRNVEKYGHEPPHPAKVSVGCESAVFFVNGLNITTQA